MSFFSAGAAFRVNRQKTDPERISGKNLFRFPRRKAAGHEIMLECPRQPGQSRSHSPDIEQIDINPLVVHQGGNPAAVDATIIKKVTRDEPAGRGPRTRRFLDCSGIT